MTGPKHCGRMDRHDEHPNRERMVYDRLTGWYLTGGGICPGVVTVEGGALEVHDCGERVHPAEIRRCCSRCEGTVCPACEPCRRVS